MLGEHPEIYSVPTETRILIDPGGLEDLAQALTDRYTPFHALRGLQTLTEFLERRAETDPYFQGFDEIFGEERYAEWRKRLLAELTWYTHGSGDWHAPVARYFGERPEECYEILRRYVDELFSAGARDAGKPYWCEKTPFNMLSTPFLLRLFPDAKVVHIARHPVQVVASHRSQDWAPNDVENVCNWLAPVYSRWFGIADELGADDRLIDLRLEDLAADWPAERAKLFARLGLPDAETPSRMDGERVTHWQHLDAADEALVRQRLGFAITTLGYE